MRYFKEIITNHVLIATVTAWAIAQVIKVLIYLLVDKRFDIKRMIGDGGMPSGHTATVMAATVMCGLLSGFGSPLFALAGIFAIVVMKDAVGVRLETTKHAATIKQLANEVNSDLEVDKRIDTDNIKRFVGHTPAEVGVGALLGIAVAIIY